MFVKTVVLMGCQAFREGGSFSLSNATDTDIFYTNLDEDVMRAVHVSKSFPHFFRLAVVVWTS